MTILGEKHKAYYDKSEVAPFGNEGTLSSVTEVWKKESGAASGDVRGSIALRVPKDSILAEVQVQSNNGNAFAATQTFYLSDKPDVIDTSSTTVGTLSHPANNNEASAVIGGGTDSIWTDPVKSDKYINWKWTAGTENLSGVTRITVSFLNL